MKKCCASAFQWIGLLLLTWAPLFSCDQATAPSVSVDLVVPTGRGNQLRQVSVRSGQIAKDAVTELPITGTIMSPVLVGGTVYALIIPSAPPFCEPGLYRIDLSEKKATLELPLRGKALSSECIIGGAGAVWMIWNGRLSAYNPSSQTLIQNDGMELRAESGLTWCDGDILCVTVDGWLARVKPSVGAVAENVRKAPSDVRLMAAADGIVLTQAFGVDRTVVAIALSGNDADIDKSKPLARMTQRGSPPAAVVATGTATFGVWDDEVRHTVTVRGFDPDWHITLNNINSRGNVCVLAEVREK